MRPAPLFTDRNRIAAAHTTILTEGEGLALITPEDVHTGKVDEVWQVRQVTMDRHHAEHPERYVNGPPQVCRPPTRVAINPDDGLPADQVLAHPNSFKTEPTPVSVELPEVVT